MSTDTTPLDRPPDWVADAIFYQIFPDRFAKSGQLPKPSGLEAWDSDPTIFGYKGGDLLGVVEHLDWIEHIGCNAIYLNPIFQSASNHRYHTHDYFRVDPLLGGDEAFRTMLDACHDRGIRVILDGVFNHASRGFFQFNDILEQGENSPWRDWFHIHGFPLNAYDQRHGPAQYDAWWGIPALPKFNTDNPAVREFLMQVGEYWIEQGIDGWRLDVPEEISTPGFWEEFRQRVRAINPDAYIVGEIWGDASWWTASGERFDGAMNYLLTGYNVSFAAGTHTNWHVSDGLQYHVKPMDAAEYAGSVHSLLAMYPDHSNRAHLNLLSSHDTARVLTVVGDDIDAVRLSALLMFTFDGAPCVYYGDEIGLDGGHDPACRAAFPWDWEVDWQTDILDAFANLARIRQQHPALRRGSYKTLHAPSDGHLYVFLREHEGDRIMVAVNASDHAANARIDGRGIGSEVSTLWGSGGVTVDGDELRVAMKPRSGAVWQLG